MLVIVKGQHSAFPISLDLSEQGHEDGNNSGDNNDSMAQELCIPATPKDCDSFPLTNINKNMNNADDRKFGVS